MPKISKATVKVIDISKVTPDVFHIVLEKPKEFKYKGGQFVNVTTIKGDKTKHTPYSIWNPSDTDHIDLVLDLVPQGFSSTILTSCKAGEEFEINGPFGHFVFDPQEKYEEHVFIGTGTGMVPLHAMIIENLEKFPEKKFTLIFGVQKKEDLIHHKYLEMLEEHNENFTYIPTLSREEWEGKTGRVTEHLPTEWKKTCFYVCGLQQMVNDVRTLLQEKGVEPVDINFERYT